jgi:site-specific DNA-methyltransferase (cytosine-N4-specific)
MIEKSQPADVAMDVPIMKIAFDVETLLTLRKLKSTIDDLSDPYRDIFLLFFFSILEECSFTSKDGQFLRLKRNKKTSNPVEAMSRKVVQVEEDIRCIKMLFPHFSIDKETMPDVYLGDTRDLSDIKFKKKPTIIITSPPYANRYDYTRTYSLELCFHFVKDFEELKAIRFGILRSHIESKIQKGEIPPHPVIKEVVELLSRKKLNNPKIPSMIVTYFIDMQKVIKEWFKVLSPGAKVAMVVDNVRFEGELIPVDLVLSEMAEEVGFEVKKIIVARYKGNSSQQMKKYGKVPVRESIVIWER